MFWLPLEIYQEETLGHPTFVIALRAKNIVAFALGKMGAWGLNNVPMTQDPWDYVHITCWNFLPFVLRRVGEAPAWVVRVAFVVWFTGLAAWRQPWCECARVARQLTRELACNADRPRWAMRVSLNGCGPRISRLVRTWPVGQAPRRLRWRPPLSVWTDWGG